MVIPHPRQIVNVRKRLSADGLYALLGAAFRRISDHRRDGCPIPLADALMSAFAMFALKDPSLLAFEERRNDANLRNLFRIQHLPCDTQMREILDPLNPESLRPAFGDVFRELQRGQALKKLRFYQGCYLLLSDGTGYFSSQQIHCDSCLEKVSSRTGEVTYQHQMLAAVLAHPNRKEVIPLAPEPIGQQDGMTKNDCERNASKRLLRKIRREHPHLKLIVVEDSLASNGPHVRELLDLGMHFILGLKAGDHAFLFDYVQQAFEDDRVTIRSWFDGEIRCEAAFLNGVPLNETNQDLLVNYLQYSEYEPDGQPRNYFTWITDFRITGSNVQLFVRGGRARWKIENETFNTLKNQGYHYQHNYGHGNQHLSVVFAMLTMLAFLIDQTQQLCCPLFGAILKKVGSKRALWDNLRSHFRHFTFQSMKHLYEVILYSLAKNLPAPRMDSS
jgi:hypothetical protein